MPNHMVLPIVLVVSMPLGVFAAPGHAEGAPSESDGGGFSYARAAGYFPAPGTKRFYLQQPCDYKIVQGRPDLKFQMKSAIQGEYPTGYGFVILKDHRPSSFDYERTRQQLVDDALPMVRQTVVQDGFVFEQVAFTTVVGGRSLLMVRLHVAPEAGSDGETLHLAWLTTRQPHDRFHSHPNEDYIVFEPWAPAWEHGLDLTYRGGCLYSGQAITALVRHTDNVSVTQDAPIPGALSLALSFEGAADAVVTLCIPYEGVQRPVDPDDTGLRWRGERAFQSGDEAALAAVVFEEEYERQRQQWHGHLRRATDILAPEPVVGRIYRTLTLGNLQFLGSAPEVEHLRPGQGGYNNFSVVYGWESSHYLTVMDKQGFHEEVRRVLDFFLTTQQGEHGPAGDISTAEGCFRPHIHWMCETGAILRIFAEHAICRRDEAELRKDSPALLKAARWISNERARTKVVDGDGHRVLHYGLMPPGRASDWPDAGHFIFTDAFTWQGLDRLARAYEEAGLPDADWLRQEADDYHRCIVEAIQRALKPHPLDPSLTWIPDELYEDPAQAIATATHNGCMALLNSNVYPPEDPLFRDMELSLRKAGGMDDYFAYKMRLMEDETLRKRQEASAGGKVDLYYLGNCEQGWHRIWLLRGERLKALRYYYMTLAYATSHDLRVSHERYSPQLPWLLPWQPNASGNGRILQMILNALVLEQEETLHLLYGAPDAWFEKGEPMGIDRLRLSSGTFSFQLRPVEGSPGDYAFTYRMEGTPPEEFLLALPSGEGNEQRRIVAIPGDRRSGATYVIRQGQVVMP